jgi:tetratricopeptide (TPR) repeat protein/anti-sigma regulatory factor (Ser/Thr protein kinase)
LHSQFRSEPEIKSNLNKVKTENEKFDLKVELVKYYLTNNLPKAKNEIDILKQSHLSKSSEFNVRIQLLQLQYYFQTKDFIPYLEIINRLTLTKINSIQSKSELMIFQGLLKQKDQKYLEALNYHKQALKFAQKIRNNYLNADILRNISLDFAYLEKKDSALYYSNRSILFARKSNAQSSILSECYNTQALIYIQFNQIEIAIAKNILALEIIENSTNAEKLSRINREIGISQLNIQNWDEAEIYFNKALNSAKILEDPAEIALALINLAATEQGRKNYSQAKKYAFEAESYANKSSNEEAIGDVNNFIGIFYNDLKDFKQAAVRLNNALVNYENIGNRSKIANVYYHVGKVLMEQGKYLESENFLNRSIGIQKEMRKINLIHLSFKALSDLNLRKNNVSEAYRFLNLYVQYLDSNNLLQSARSIAELNETFKTQEQLRTINLQSDSIKRAKERQELTNSKLENTQLRNTYQLFLIIFILIVVLAGGLILRNYWNRSKLLQLQKETEMSQTLLRSQMNPHFIFNAMTVIQSYIYDNEPTKSSKFLVNFSRLMRLILENSSKEFISLDTEMDILQKYLTTQKLRFEDRFTFEISSENNLSESETLIPPMITQPFIENSIEHGQLHTVDEGFIHIHFSSENEMLIISISDNGIGRKNASKNKKSKEHHSMALKITEERIGILNRKYNTNGKLEISDYNKENETGTVVHIEIPLKFKNQIS